VCVVTALQAGQSRNLYLNSGEWNGIFSSPVCSDQLWDSLSLVFNEYQHFVAEIQAATA
jgi:hypothetical protein